MTLLHGARSGDLVRARRRHQLPAGHPELRLRLDPGLARMAEAHPVGFRWAMKARERGAKIIHVDPHFSRTSAVADMLRPDPRRLGHRVPRRADPPHHRDGVVLQGVRRQLHERARRSSTRTSRTPRTSRATSPATTPRPAPTTARRGCTRAARCRPPPASASTPRRRSARRPAPGMHDRQGRAATRRSSTRAASSSCCKRHYARYTPEMVERVCGIPQEQFLEIAETLIANSGRERTDDARLRRRLDAALDRRADDPRRRDRAAAARQRRAARAAAIMAMRGHASIQGSSDIPTLYDLLPGYLPMPRAAEGDLTLADYVESGGSDARLVVALRQVHRLAAARPGSATTPPRRTTTASAICRRSTGNHSHFPTMLRALDGGLDGLFVMGQNPAVGSQHAGLQRRALAKLKWLVVRDLADARDRALLEGLAGGAVGRAQARRTSRRRSSSCPPRATSRRRATSPTRSGCCSGATRRSTRRATRARSCTSCTTSAKRVIAALRGLRRDRKDWPLRNLTWDYSEHGEHAEPRRRGRAARRSTATRSTTGRRSSGFARARGRRHAPPAAAGSTRAASPTASTRPRRRDPGDLDDAAGGSVSPGVGLGVAGEPPHPLQPRVRRPRRASRGRSARSTSGGTRRREAGRATTSRTSRPASAPTTARPDDAEGMDAISGDDPFIMMADGRGWLFSPSGLLDGADADALRAARVAGRQRALSEGRQRTRSALTWVRPREPARPAGRRALPASSPRRSG